MNKVNSRSSGVGPSLVDGSHQVTLAPKLGNKVNFRKFASMAKMEMFLHRYSNVNNNRNRTPTQTLNLWYQSGRTQLSSGKTQQYNGNLVTVSHSTTLSNKIKLKLNFVVVM